MSPCCESHVQWYNRQWLKIFCVKVWHRVWINAMLARDPLSTWQRGPSVSLIATLTGVPFPSVRVISLNLPTFRKKNIYIVHGANLRAIFQTSLWWYQFSDRATRLVLSTLCPTRAVIPAVWRTSENVQSYSTLMLNVMFLTKIRITFNFHSF